MSQLCLINSILSPAYGVRFPLARKDLQTVPVLLNVYGAPELIPSRVRPFRLKKFFAYKRNKANLDPFHMCFTISL
jgi:hypothetical protein